MGEGDTPQEFTRINWIESNRTQYLDLGIMGSNGRHKFAVDMLLPVATNQNTTVFGCRWDNPAPVRRTGNMYFNQALAHALWIGTSTGLLSQAHVQNQRFQYSMEVDEPKHIVTTDYNGTVRSASFSGSAITNAPVFLFGANLNGNVVERGSFRIFGFQIWKDGEFFRDLVPVLDVNGEALMYCKASQQAYYNQGSGAFAWG